MGNRSYDEIVRRKNEFPKQYEILRQIHNGRVGGTCPRFELNYLGEDPEELENLATDIKYRDDLQRLCKALRDWAERTGDRYISTQKIMSE